MSRFPEPFYPEEPEYLGPTYDAEDIGCDCNNDDPNIESDWQWDVEQQCYICAGCGEVQ